MTLWEAIPSSSPPLVPLPTIQWYENVVSHDLEPPQFQYNWPLDQIFPLSYWFSVCAHWLIPINSSNAVLMMKWKNSDVLYGSDAIILALNLWSGPSVDEPGIVVGPDTLPFLHFCISAPMLTYHDARNRRDAPCELRKPTRSQARSMLNFR